MRRIAMCFLAAFVGWAGMAAAVDIRELQAKLAAQEAALNDIEAKMADEEGDGTPEQMTSMRKNAKVTIGGLVSTSYIYNRGNLKHRDNGRMVKTIDAKNSSVELSDAELEVEIEVNEHMDAYLLMDLHASHDERDSYGTAKAYWVRWKNICDTGFGLKVGRDSLVFGDGESQVGFLDNFTQSNGDGIGSWYEDFPLLHNIWDMDGVTQITPYWEGFDGKLLLETSFMAHVWNGEGPYINGGGGASRWSDRNGVAYSRSRNYGLGTMSARATWTPIEDLRFSASVVNFHSNGTGEYWEDAFGRDDLKYAKNNTAVALSFNWRPCFFNRMNIWGQYVHGWNAAHVDDAKSDVVNFGASFDLTEKLTFFAQGDYLRISHKDLARDRYKETAWAAYAGLIYDLGDGATLEAGWRHEKLKMKDNGTLTNKAKNDTIYANLAFEF